MRINFLCFSIAYRRILSVAPGCWATVQRSGNHQDHGEQEQGHPEQPELCRKKACQEKHPQNATDGAGLPRWRQRRRDVPLPIRHRAPARSRRSAGRLRRDHGAEADGSLVCCRSWLLPRSTKVYPCAYAAHARSYAALRARSRAGLSRRRHGVRQRAIRKTGRMTMQDPPSPRPDRRARPETRGIRRNPAHPEPRAELHRTRHLLGHVERALFLQIVQDSPRTLPTTGPQVICGPGENAGVVDIGDGQAVVFKMESHNHPSYIEPYQGAATGVGGILRDVFTMGARPGRGDERAQLREKRTTPRRGSLHGVVEGIGGYGNASACPPWAARCAFDPPITATASSTPSPPGSRMPTGSSTRRRQRRRPPGGLSRRQNRARRRRRRHHGQRRIRR